MTVKNEAESLFSKLIEKGKLGENMEHLMVGDDSYVHKRSYPEGEGYWALFRKGNFNVVGRFCGVDLEFALECLRKVENRI